MERILEWFFVHNGWTRPALYLIVFLLLAFGEAKTARHRPAAANAVRWPHNLGLNFLNAFVNRLVFSGSAVWAAYWAGNHGFGLFFWQPVPGLFGTLFTLVFLDWMLYYQHRIFHWVPWLWKIHRVHHTDLQVDVTTASRFHTLEALLSTLIRSFFVVLLGAPPFAVFFFEVVLNASLLFEHSNIDLPARWEKVLRFLVVTPGMHAVHHSTDPREYGSNFGFILSWWDRLLGTYKAEPEKSLQAEDYGLDVFHQPSDLALDRVLMQPFLDRNGSFAWKNLTRVEKTGK